MIEEFRKQYGAAEGLRVFRAPGRVNVIGEHTDYNLGFVMPMALDLATYIGTAPSSDGKLRIYSEDRSEMREWDAARIRETQRERHWTDYPIGVAHELIKPGFPIEPANLYIRSTVPEGSGLSSSAALEVSSALAFLHGRSLQPLELAKLCQRAEVQFVGMPCGIMDQYVSVFGREHSAVAIDCRSLEHRYVELPDAAAFIAVNTMVKHALGGVGLSGAGAGMRGRGAAHPEALSHGGVAAGRIGGPVRSRGETFCRPSSRGARATS